MESIMFFKEEMIDFSKIKLLKKAAYRLMIENGLGRLLDVERANVAFPGSTVYWERRYQNKGNSGVGSYGEKAIYKANFLNAFVAEKEIKSVIELGCGDGNQLGYFKFREYK